MKILVIRFSSIGDIVLTSPVLRCLKNQIPNVEIHYLTKHKFSVLVKSNPYVSKVHEFADSLSPVIGELKKEKFDLVLDLHNNLRSLHVKMALRVPGHTFSKLNFKKWLLVRFKIQAMPNVHIVRRYMKTVEKLKVDYDGQGLDWFFENEEFPDVRLPNAPFVVYAIGGTYSTKRLPLNKILELVPKITMPLVLIGDKKDKIIGDELVNKYPEIYNLCGLLNISESAMVIQKAHKVIAHDSGMMHIAAALNKDLITIWGNTVPELGMYPLFPKGLEKKSQIFEVENLSCRPCSKLGFSECPKGHFRCMEMQDLDRIAEKLR